MGKTEWYWSADGDHLFAVDSRERAIGCLVEYYKTYPGPIVAKIGKLSPLTAESCLTRLSLEDVLESMTERALDEMDVNDDEVFMVDDMTNAQTHLDVLNEALAAWATKYIKSECLVQESELDASAEVSALVLS